MEAIRHDMHSLEWWFSVVVVGIIVGLIATYLKMPVDRSINWFSEWRASRTEKQRAARERRLRYWIENPNEHVLGLIVALHGRVRCVFFLVIAMIFGLLAQSDGKNIITVFMYGLMAISMVFANIHLFDAQIKCYEIYKAKRMIREKQAQGQTS